MAGNIKGITIEIGGDTQPLQRALKGINKEAAESLGTKGTSLQMKIVILSGALCGLGGVCLAMGNVTLFAENMTS